jgi:hypothetical protein
LFSVSEKTLKGAGNESSNVNSRARASEAEHLGLFNNRSATTGPPVKEPEKKNLITKNLCFYPLSVTIKSFLILENKGNTKERGRAYRHQRRIGVALIVSCV